MNREYDPFMPDLTKILAPPRISVDSLMGAGNKEEFVAICEKCFGVPESKVTVGDIAHIPVGTARDPSKLEREILALSQVNAVVRIADNTQKLLQRRGLAKTDGRLRTLNALPTRHVFSFADNEEYKLITAACARRDSRARIGRSFHVVGKLPPAILRAIRNYISTHANQVFLMVVAGATAGVIVLVISRCFL